MLLGSIINVNITIYSHFTLLYNEGQESLADRHLRHVRFFFPKPFLALRTEQFRAEAQRFSHVTLSFLYHFESLYSKGVLSARRLKNLLKKEGLGKSISSEIWAMDLSVCFSSILMCSMRARSIHSLAVVPLA